MSSDFNDLPNPFAQLSSVDAEGSSGRRSKKSTKQGGSGATWPVSHPAGRRKRALIQAVKYLFAVMVCFAVLLGIRHATGHWLLNRLTHDFHQLSSEDQQQRLLQMEGLGQPAIPHLVDAMAAKEIATARTAYELLRHSQNEWTTLRPSELQRRHLVLAKSIHGVSAQLPDDRTGWAAALLQQSIMDSVSQKNPLEASVYHAANETLASLSLGSRSGPSILDGEYREGDLLRPVVRTANEPSDQPSLLKNRRLAISPAPLPIDQDPRATRWSDWPPTEEKRSASRRAASPSNRSVSLRLKPVDLDDPVILRPIESPVETSFEVMSAKPTAPITKVTHSEDLPLDAYDDRSVMHWLVSPHGKLRNKAAIELVARGYSDRDLELAHHMVHHDTQVRLAFLDRLTRDAQIDPRPWLWMMADDENREVRLRVVSILATMNDHAAEDRLRTLMVQERDPTVAARIRRVLNLR